MVTENGVRPRKDHPPVEAGPGAYAAFFLLLAHYSVLSAGCPSTWRLAPWAGSGQETGLSFRIMYSYAWLFGEGLMYALELVGQPVKFAELYSYQAAP